MKSMTGYGRAQDNTSIGTVTVELTSVNHRNLDVRLRLPDICRFFEIELRQLLKNHLRRGHVEGSIKIERDETAFSHDIVLNLPITTAYYNEAKRFYDTIGIALSPDFSWIFSRPEVWQVSETPETETIQSALLPVFEKALSQLVHSREQEGGTLKSFFMEKIRELLGKVIQNEQLIHVILAIFVFIVGWVACQAISKIMAGLLHKIKLDERLNKKAEGTPVKLEGVISKFVYYVLLIYVLMISLDLLGAKGVLDPLKVAMEKLFAVIPDAIAAVFIGFLRGISLKAVFLPVSSDM